MFLRKSYVSHPRRVQTRRFKNITPTSTTVFKYLARTRTKPVRRPTFTSKIRATYTAEIGGAADFAFTSNTVSGTIKTIEPTLRAGYRKWTRTHVRRETVRMGFPIQVGTAGELGVGDASNRSVPTLCTGITQGQVEKFLDTDGNATP